MVSDVETILKGANHFWIQRIVFPTRVQGKIRVEIVEIGQRVRLCRANLYQKVQIFNSLGPRTNTQANLRAIRRCQILLVQIMPGAGLGK